MILNCVTPATDTSISVGLLLRTTQMQEEEVNYQHKQSPGRQKGVQGLS